MSFEVISSSGNLISIKISGELKKAELDRMQASATEFIKREGKIRILVFLEDFLGWERGADWEDVNFQLEHDRDIEKIAVVGDEKWRNLALAFTGKPFRPVKIEYFTPSQLDQARAWIA
ncbi:MAG: STAS/SEC14 domain-containing protein [Candidatus Brocadia sp.]|nr:STAS/SEC14 domain-containing protein [Candidatus Brocadia sp.]